MGKNMCRVGYIITFSLRRCGFALRVRPLAKQLLDVRLTNWQLLGGSRAKELLRRALRGKMCAVLHLRAPLCAQDPEAERENRRGVGKKLPDGREKRGVLRRKCASFCAKCPILRIFLPIVRPRGRSFPLSGGVFGCRGDSMQTK